MAEEREGAGAGAEDENELDYQSTSYYRNINHIINSGANIYSNNYYNHLTNINKRDYLNYQIITNAFVNGYKKGFKLIENNIQSINNINNQSIIRYSNGKNININKYKEVYIKAHAQGYLKGREKGEIYHRSGVEEGKIYNIVISGHGIINSNKFIITPENMDITFYTEKGKPYLRSLIKDIYEYIILNNGNKKHYIKEKTLLNDMTIQLLGMFQFDPYKCIPTTLTNISNVSFITYSGLITNKNITPICNLSEEEYAKYNVKVVKPFINLQRNFFKNVLDRFDYNKELKPIHIIIGETITEINNMVNYQIDEYEMKEELEENETNILQSLISFERSYMRILEDFVINRSVDSYINKFNDKFMKTDLSILKSDERFLELFNKYTYLMNIYEIINEIKKYIVDNNRYYNNYLNYNIEYFKNISLFFFNEEENIVGFGDKNAIAILYNELLQIRYCKDNSEQIFMCIVILLYLKKNETLYNTLLEYFPKNNNTFMNSIIRNNIVRLSYHYHNEDIIPYDIIRSKNFFLSLGEIFKYINDYNKNVLNKQKILCHSINCRNYSPIHRNRNVQELIGYINSGAGAGAEEEVEINGLRRTNSLVHHLIRQPSESEEYKNIFENIIEKCLDIIINNTLKIENKVEYTNKNYNNYSNNNKRKINKLIEDEIFLTNIQKIYKEQYYLTKNHIKFLISILQREE